MVGIAFTSSLFDMALLELSFWLLLLTSTIASFFAFLFSWLCVPSEATELWEIFEALLHCTLLSFWVQLIVKYESDLTHMQYAGAAHMLVGETLLLQQE